MLIYGIIIFLFFCRRKQCSNVPSAVILFFFLWEELILVCRRPLVEGHSVVSFTDNAFSSVTLQVSQTGLMKRLTVTH